MSREAQYLEFMNGFLRGEAPSAEQFLLHFEHQNGVPADALPVGSTAPDLDLPDQHGVRRSLAGVMGERGALVVFVRSTYWCPYCRNQLAELNLRVGQARRAGWGIVAIAPDPVERVAEFCAKHDVGYPIVSDPTGGAIAAYGVRNHDIPPNELQGHAPLPHPGIFVVDAARRIIAREFTGDIRHRVSASAVIAEHADAPDATGAAGAGAVRVDTDDLSAVVSLSADEVFGGQEIGVTIAITIAPGLHVYGSEVAAPYSPLGVRLDSAEAIVSGQTFSYPSAETVHLAALDEELPVLSGRIVVRGRIRLRWSPPRSPFAELAAFVAERAISPGRYQLDGAIRYQACTDVDCHLPAVATFTLPIDVASNAAAGSPVRLGATVIPATGDEA